MRIINFTKRILANSFLVLLGLQIFSAVQANELTLAHDVKISELQEAQGTLSASSKSKSGKQLSLNTQNGNLLFELTPNEELFTARMNFQFPTELTVFKGKIEGVDDSWARFTIINGALSGAYFDGQQLFIVEQQDKLVAQKGRIQRMQSGTPNLLVYNANDITHSGTCALHEATTSSSFSYQEYVEELTQMTAQSAEQELKVSLTADVEFENSNAQPAAAEMVAEMNIVNGIFAEQVGVAIAIDELQVLQSNGNLTPTDAQDLIVAYRTYVATEYSNPGASHLFTGKNLNGGTIGIAYVGALCNSYAIGVTQRFGGNTALVTAHEFGHNFGAPHDNQSGSACQTTAGGFLMNPSINGSDQFSNCSVSQMQQTINGAFCLVDVSPPEIVSTANPSAQVGEAYQYDNDNTLDVDGSGEFFYSLDFGPENMQISQSGALSWTPNQQQVGSHSVQITVSSPYGSDSQLFDVNVEGEADVSYFDFSGKSVSSFSRGQDITKDARVINQNAGIELSGNTWKKVELNYTITENTVIEFDFISSQMGEIHAIGLDDNNYLDPQRTFNLFGTQTYGIEDFKYTNFGAVQRLSIPVGNYYQGQARFMYFGTDNDVSNPVSNGQFSNIRVFEKDPEGEEDPVDPEVTTINFNDFIVSEYHPRQNISGYHEVQQNGDELRLFGNIWRKIEVDAELNPDTVIEFEYRSDSEGEIHGLGFSNEDQINATQTFQFHGSQEWGITDYQYTQVGQWQTFAVPVGQFFTGNFKYLTFSMDNDVANPTAEGRFRNITFK